VVLWAEIPSLRFYYNPRVFFNQDMLLVSSAGLFLSFDYRSASLPRSEPPAAAAAAAAPEDAQIVTGAAPPEAYVIMPSGHMVAQPLRTLRQALQLTADANSVGTNEVRSSTSNEKIHLV
jgi:hypothetical protein